jgi:ATP-dependent helicase/DNAse subunit B
MKFFYRYVNGLREPETISRDIDPAMLGEILHDVMRTIYSEYTGSLITTDKIDDIINDKRTLGGKILNALNQKFSGGNDRTVEGTEFIIRDVLMSYVMKILKADKEITPFRILKLESAFSFPLSIPFYGSSVEIITGGIADRIDMTDGVTRIVDYKTGSVAERINSIGDLFEYDRKKEYDGWLQTMLYCEAYLQIHAGINIRPSVYRIKKLSSESGGDKLRIRSEGKNDIPLEDYSSVRDEFMNCLISIISDIFNPEKPFVMTNDLHGKCSWCPYRGLCLR